MSRANRIRQFRKARGLTQVEFAAALDVNEATVVRWERGYTALPESVLDRLASFFHVAPTDLVPDLTRVRTEEMTHA